MVCGDAWRPPNYGADFFARPLQIRIYPDHSPKSSGACHSIRFFCFLDGASRANKKLKSG